MEYRKFMRKDKLNYKNGYLVNKKNKVCQPDPVIVHQLNSLDRLCQYADKVFTNGVATKIISDVVNEDDFEFESEHANYIKVSADTPLLNEKIENTKAIMKEIDEKEKADTISELIDMYKEAVEFITNDSFIVSNATARFDLPFIGDPIDVDTDILIHFIFEKIAKAANLEGGIINLRHKVGY